MKRRPVSRRENILCHCGYGPPHFFWSNNPRWERTCPKCKEKREQESSRHGQSYSVDDTGGRVIRKRIGGEL